MTTNKRPNILLITSDQQHWNTLGKFNPEIKTPALDRLANEGTVFSRAYCPNPTCTPSRASIITGLYPSQHGAYSLGTRLTNDLPTLGDCLQKGGYDASLIGKAHFQPLVSTPEHPSLESYPILRDLDYWRDMSGPFYGFNHIELARNHTDECHVGQHYALWMEEKGLKDWKRHFQNTCLGFDFTDGQGVNPPQYGRWTLPEEYHYNTWIAERTCARIDHCTQEEKPFFVWASFFDPHPPYLIPEPWDSLYDPDKLTVPEITPGEHERNPVHFRMTQEENPDFSAWQEPGGNATHGLSSHLEPQEKRARNMSIYYGMISCMDKYIGRILDHLDARGLSDDTIVIFTTDHGHFFGQHGLCAKGPFHYEDLVKIPMIVRWPGKVPADHQSPAMQSLVDYTPTLLSMAGLPTPATITGIDQSPVWTGESKAARQHVVVENRHQPTTIHVKTYIDERYKLTVYYNHDYGELFDLDNDPAELNNLWDAPEAASLKQALLLKTLHAEMGKEPLPMPRIAPA